MLPPTTAAPLRSCRHNHTINPTTAPHAPPSSKAVTLSRRRFSRNHLRDSVTALLLGGACGAVVGLIVWLWRRDLSGAAVVGGRFVMALFTRCLFGFSVSELFH